ncbi:MAG TPA: lytic murein transglycosylase [Caulobacteraceae bacterium]|nr:lytic murein transglycosylase [Caulobacteraceae bacterium]
MIKRSPIDRRTFVVLLLAGCADVSRPPPVIPTTPVPTPTQPTPTPPATGDLTFEEWRASYRARALREGIPAAVLDRELAGLTPNTQVASLDTRQPEFSKPVSDYLKSAVSDARISEGRGYRDSLAFLGPLEQQYGVPREVVLAIWAMETNFGKIRGDFDVIRALATLAWEGRRRDWAEGELTAALRILTRGEATRSQLRGSWAGAMGHTQFMPSVFLSTAVDGNGDGTRDIWNSAQDALASTANYLAKAGWRRGESWAEEVVLPPGFDYALAEGERRTPAAWEALGVKRAGGLPWTSADAAAQAQLLLPAGANGPAILAFPNHFAIRKYNNSISYALAVGMLADRFAGEGGWTASWPYEVPLSLAARQQAQRDLTKLGFDTGGADGIIGPNSRKALRAWQASRGLPADAYLTVAIIQRLRTEASSVP